MAHQTAAIPMTRMTFKVIHQLHAFSNVICDTAVQQLRKYQLT